MMEKTSIQPLNNKVLVKRSRATVSKGGILLPETAQEKPKEGTIIAVGPGKTDDSGKIEPMHVQIGDKVLFGGYAGTEVKNIGEKSEDDEYLILSEDEILGILCSN